MALSRLLPGSAQLLRANCASSDLVGDCVYVTGDRIGERTQVTKTDPRELSQIPSIGIIEVKESSMACLVRMTGPLAVGIYSGLVPQQQLWVGLDGRVTANQTGITALLGGRVALQEIGVALASDVVLVRPQVPLIRVG